VIQLVNGGLNAVLLIVFIEKLIEFVIIVQNMFAKTLHDVMVKVIVLHNLETK